MQLKVGGMGLNIFDRDKLLESHLYFGMKEWHYSKKFKTFDIQLKQVGAQRIQFKTDEGLEIAKMMGHHAQHLAQAKKEEQASDSQEIEKSEEGTPPEDKYVEVDTADPASVIGYYHVINPIQARHGVEVDTPTSGNLNQGDVIWVSEWAHNSSGTTRLRCAVGYVSLKPHLLKRLRGYTPGEVDKTKILEHLNRALQIYRCLPAESTGNIARCMIETWGEIFPAGVSIGSDGVARPVDTAHSRELAKLKATLAEDRANSARIIACLEQENSKLKKATSVAGGETANVATAAKLEAENNQVVAELARLKLAAADLKAETEKAEDKLAILRGQHEALQTKVVHAKARAADDSIMTSAQEPSEVSLPKDVQDVFEQANNADAVRSAQIPFFQNPLVNLHASLAVRVVTKRRHYGYTNQALRRQ